MLIPTFYKDKFLYINNTVAAIMLATIMIFGLFTVPVFISVHATNATKVEREVCGHFQTQPDAQAYYNKYINNPQLSKTVKGMDRNGNGIACENNPIQ